MELHEDNQLEKKNFFYLKTLERKSIKKARYRLTLF